MLSVRGIGPLQINNVCALQESNTKWSLQFNMNYLKQTFGSVGQQPVSGECLMMPFYCFRRSRSSKLSFCSPQGTRAAAVRIHSALCLCAREEVGQASSHGTVFTGGWALGGHHNIVVLPFCAEERGACEYCRSGRHHSRVRRWSNGLFGMIQQYVHACQWMWMCANCFKQNTVPLGL